MKTTLLLAVLAGLPAAAFPAAGFPAAAALPADAPPVASVIPAVLSDFRAVALLTASAVPAGAVLTGDNPLPAVYTSPVFRSVSQAAAFPADDWPEALSSFAARADTCGFSFGYVIRTTGGTGFPGTGAGGFSGTGEAVVQGGAFRQTGDGMSRYCNGTTLWLIDETEKEAVIEPTDREMPETGLSALFSAAALEKYFAPPATEKAVFNGVRTDCFVLLPSAGHADGEVERLKIHFQKDLPIGLEIQFADGVLATISLLKPRFLPRREPLSAFEFASENLDASWTVTDLRD